MLILTSPPFQILNLRKIKQNQFIKNILKGINQLFHSILFSRNEKMLKKKMRKNFFFNRNLSVVSVLTIKQ